MANKTGRNRSRLHVKFADRDHKVCVSTQITQEWKHNLAESIREYLEGHMPNGRKKKLMDGGATSVTVSFVLGKAGIALGVRVIDVSLNDVRNGHTNMLFARIDEAATAARRQLGLTESEAMKEAS